MACGIEKPRTRGHMNNRETQTASFEAVFLFH